MSVIVLLGIGIVTGLTTVLFGFGGGFVTVPVIVWADAGLGAAAAHVAVATSSVVMVVDASVATAATDRTILRQLRGSAGLMLLLALGGAVGTMAAQHAPGPVTRWGFVTYLVITIIDLLLRPGFFRPRADAPSRPDGNTAIPVVLGVPIGAVAAFLGVGGSVMTVPLLLRRSGRDMRTATSLANPLTLAIAIPAMAIFLTGETAPGGRAAVFLSGSVDLGAAAALLAGAARHHHPAPTPAAHTGQSVLLELPGTARPRHHRDGHRITTAQLAGPLGLLAAAPVRRGGCC